MDHGQAKEPANHECTLCNYTTTSADDFVRHESGLLHHVKLEQKNRKCKHKCALCGVTTESLKDFGRHANEAVHQARIAWPSLLPQQQQQQKSADSQQNLATSGKSIELSANQQQQVLQHPKPATADGKLQCTGNTPVQQQQQEEDAKRNERKLKNKLKRQRKKQKMREEKEKLMGTLQTEPNLLQKPEPAAERKGSTCREPVAAAASQVQPCSFARATIAAAQRPEIRTGPGTRSRKLKADCVDCSTVPRPRNADRINRSPLLRPPKTDCINPLPVPWQKPERQSTASGGLSASGILTHDSALTATTSVHPKLFDDGQLVPLLVNGGSERRENCETAASSVRCAKLSGQSQHHANANVAIAHATGGNPADRLLVANTRVAGQPSSNAAAGSSEACPAFDERRVVHAAKERTSVRAALRPMSLSDVPVNEPFVRLVPLVFDRGHKCVALPAALNHDSGGLVSHQSPSVGTRSSAAATTATADDTAAVTTTDTGAAVSAVATSNSATVVNGAGSRPKAKGCKLPKKAAKLRLGTEDSRFLLSHPPAALASCHRNTSGTSEAAQKLETSSGTVTASLDTSMASLAAARPEVAAAGDATRPPLSSDVSLKDVATQRQPTELPAIASEASSLAQPAKTIGNKPSDDEDVLGLVSSALSTKDRLRLRKIYTLARRNASAANSLLQGPELGRVQKVRTFHLDGDDAGSSCDTAVRLLDGIKLEALSAEEQLQLTSIVSSVLLTDENPRAGFVSPAVGESVAAAKDHGTGAAAKVFCNQSPLVAVKSERPEAFSASSSEAGDGSTGTVSDLSFPSSAALAAAGNRASGSTSSDRADPLGTAGGSTAASTSEGSHNENEPPADVSSLLQLASRSTRPRSGSHRTLGSFTSPAKSTSRHQWPGGRPLRLAQSIGNPRRQVRKLHVGAAASDWLSSTKRKRRAQHITESLVASSGRNSPVRSDGNSPASCWPYSAAKRRNVMAAAADSSCSSSEGSGCDKATGRSTDAHGDTALTSVVEVAGLDALPAGTGVSHNPDYVKSASSGADSGCDPSPTSIRALPTRVMESDVRAGSPDRVCSLGTNSSDVSATREETAVRSPLMLLDGHSDASSRPCIAQPMPSAERHDTVVATCKPAESPTTTCCSSVVHGPTGCIGAAWRTAGSTAMPRSTASPRCTARLPFGPEALGNLSAGRTVSSCINAPTAAATASGSPTVGRLTSVIAAVAQRPLRPRLPDGMDRHIVSATASGSPTVSRLTTVIAAVAQLPLRPRLPDGMDRHIVSVTSSGSPTVSRLTNTIAAVAQRPLRPLRPRLPDGMDRHIVSAASPLACSPVAAIASPVPEARVSSPLGSQPQPMSLHRASSAGLVSNVPKQQLSHELQQPVLVEQLPIVQQPAQQPAADGRPAAGGSDCGNVVPPQPPVSASLTARLAELVDISKRQGKVDQSLAQAHGEMVRLRDEISSLQTTFDSHQREAELLKQEKARLAQASRDILTDLAIIEEASRLAATLLPVPSTSVGTKRKDACEKTPLTKKKKVPATGKPLQNPSRDCHGGKAAASGGSSSREIESACVKIEQEVLENEMDNVVPTTNTERLGIVKQSSHPDGRTNEQNIVRRATPTEATTVTVGSCPANSDSRAEQVNSEQELDGDGGSSVEQQSLCPTTTYGGHTGAILDITARGGHLYTGSLDCTARKYDIETGQCLAVYSGHTSAVWAVRVVGSERDGYRLYTGTSGGILTVFDVKTGEALEQHSLRSAVQCMCDAWDYVYVGLASGKVASFSAAMSSTVSSFACSEQAVTCLSTATEGGRRLLCVGSQDQSVTLRDARSGLLIRQLVLPGNLRPAVLMVSEVESVIYVAAKKSHILAFSIETAQQIMSFSQSCRGGWIKSAVLLSEKRLLTASTDSYVRLINLETKAVVNVYRGDPSCIMLCMCCSSSTFFTGDSAGHVVGQGLSTLSFPCEHAKCQLTFGWYDHLQQHVAKEHNSPADSSCRGTAEQGADGKPSSVNREQQPSESETTREQVTRGRGAASLSASGSNLRATRSVAAGDKGSRQLTLK